MAGKGKKSGNRGGVRKTDGEDPLIGRYRSILVEKLTKEDLAELKLYLRNQFDDEGNLVREYKEKFEEKLRSYLHEEVLTREIIGIEALIRDLEPGDLKK
jgi:hypothetical protein